MVTIREVAADAGVARSTVSYVLSGKKRLPEATRERVLRSVAKLGYRPDPAARALALKRTNILGFLARVKTESPQADVSVFMDFVRAAMYEAHSRGFDLLVMGRGEEELRGDPLADALIVMDIRQNDSRLPELEAIGLPTVLIGSPEQPTTFSWIDLDFEQAGRLAVEHLVDLGHRRIVLVGAPPHHSDELGFEQRFRDGFLSACAEQAVRGECVPAVDGAGRETPGDGEWLAEASRVLPAFTAVVSQGPGDLIPVLRELAAAGVNIPVDCSIVTVAPIDVMRHSDHPVTVIDLPGDAMVRRAVAMVLDEVTGASTGRGAELLPAVLHDLGTTAPAARSSR